jgi:hypothetical protein
MADAPTADQVVDAAQNLGPKFTRAELAGAIGCDVSELKDGVKEAREGGRLEKAGEDSDGKGVFQLA